MSDHFQRLRNSSRVDPDKVKQYKVDSPDKCAALCLDKESVAVLESNSNFICRSFDYCENSGAFFCAFYNNSTLTDPSVILDSASRCDHYAS